MDLWGLPYRNLGPAADLKGDIDIQIRDLDQTVIGNPAHDSLRLGLSLVSRAESRPKMSIVGGFIGPSFLALRPSRIRHHTITEYGKPRYGLHGEHLAAACLRESLPHQTVKGFVLRKFFLKPLVVHLQCLSRDLDEAAHLSEFRSEKVKLTRAASQSG